MHFRIFVIHFIFYYQRLFAENGNILLNVSTYEGGIMTRYLHNGMTYGDSSVLLAEGDKLEIRCVADFAVRWILWNDNNSEISHKMYYTKQYQYIDEETGKVLLGIEHEETGKVLFGIENITNNYQNLLATCIFASHYDESNHTELIRLLINKQHDGSKIKAVTIRINLYELNGDDQLKVTRCTLNTPALLYTTTYYFNKFMVGCYLQCSNCHGASGLLFVKLEKIYRIHESASGKMYNASKEIGILDVSTSSYFVIKTVAQENHHLKYRDGELYSYSYDLSQFQAGSYIYTVFNNNQITIFKREFEIRILSDIDLELIHNFQIALSYSMYVSSFSKPVQEIIDSVKEAYNASLNSLICLLSGHQVSAARLFVYWKNYSCSFDPAEWCQSDQSMKRFYTNYSKAFANYTTVDDVVVILPFFFDVNDSTLNTGFYGCGYDSNGSWIKSKSDIRFPFKYAKKRQVFEPQSMSANVVSSSLDEIVVGENVTLRCSLNSQAFFAWNWSWKISGSEVYSPHQLLATANSVINASMYTTTINYKDNNTIDFDLTILDISMGQSGTYRCIGISIILDHIGDPYQFAHETGKGEQLVLEVQERQDTIINTDFQLKKPKNNDDIELYCNVNGSPTPKISWSKRGDYEKCQKNICDSQRITASSGFYHKLLHIRNFSDSDVGIYICEAKNKLGVARKEFDLQIESSESSNEYLRYLIPAIISSFLITIVIILAIRFYYYIKRKMHFRQLYNKIHGSINEQTVTEPFAGFLPELPVIVQSEQLIFDKSYEIPLENLTISADPLGEGTFGKVVRGTVKLEGTEDGANADLDLDVALKSPAGAHELNQYAMLLAEMKVMMHFNAQHVNIIQLLAVYTKELWNGKLYAVLEYCENGSLSDYLQRKDVLFRPLRCLRPPSSYDNARNLISTNNRIVINEIDLMSYGYQIVDGIEFLASKNIIHRDLALRNILLTKSGIAKITDFGLARVSEKYYKVKNRNQQLPIKWMAIEAIVEDKFSKESDIWSFGIILWELFSFGAEPYGELDNDHVIAMIESGRRLDAPLDCPQLLFELMRKCWQKDRKDRPLFSECKTKLAETAISTSESEWQKCLDVVSDAKENLSIPKIRGVDYHCPPVSETTL